MQPTREAPGDIFGCSVSNAGDFNGDGFGDIVVGAYLNDAGGLDAGRAYVYYGGQNADSIADLVFTGQSAYQYFGFSVSSAGDFNGDGFADILIGTYFGNGRVYLFFGGPHPDTVADIIFSGREVHDLFGGSVSDAGDFNGDGFGDIIVGASNSWNKGIGRAYVFYGGPIGDAVADLVLTRDIADDGFGQSVSGAGDFNNDGFTDVIVGSTSKADVFFGGSGPDSIPDVTFTSEIGEDSFGRTVSYAGDCNGDGFGDVIVGAPFSDYGGIDSGQAFVFFGGPEINTAADLTLTGEGSDDAFGYSVSNAGDINGDGFDDLIVGAYRNSADGFRAGRAYVYLGGIQVDAIPDEVFNGEAESDFLGTSVSGAGDVNGDLKADVVVGATEERGDRLDGRAYVFACPPSISTVQVSAGAGDSKNVDISVNKSEGKISLVWVGSTSGVGRIYFARFSVLGERLVDETPVSLGEYPAGDPSCSVDQLGNTHIVWKQQGALVYCKVSPSGAALVSPKTIVQGPIDFPSIEMAPDGAGHLVWVAALNPRVTMYRKLDGSGSPYPGCGDRILNQTKSGISTEYPAVTPPVSPSNQYAFVAWHNGTAVYNDVLYVSAVYPNCNGLTNPAENTNNIRIGRIAMAPIYSQLNVYILFEGIGPDNNQHIYVLNNAGIYSQIDDDGGTASHCDIATIGDANILAVWDDSSSCARLGVYSQTFSGNTETPSGSICLLSDPEGRAMRPSVAGVSQGVYAVAWDQEVGAQREIILHMKTPTEPCEGPPDDGSDRDGDGLLDCWEVSGVPVAGGTERLVLAGADPDHKDLFLELDAMEGQAPDPSALEAVKNAFAAVPNSLLMPPNPDGLDGITLHITGGSGPSACDPCVDDSSIVAEDWPDLSQFYQVKCSYFGTDGERMSANANAILAAKARAFRYGIFARTGGTQGETGHAEGPDERGPGNDFMVTLASLADATWEEQAGTLMHELGHTLGFWHGGGDDIGYKPNYYSVMNYMWQMPTRPNILAINPWALDEYRNSWKLDYSREELPTLDESHLNETHGIGGNPDLWTPVGPPIGWIVPLSMLVPMGGALDWNRNLLRYETDVAADANYIMGASGAEPGQVLAGYCDWSHLNYLPNTTIYWTQDEGCGALGGASASPSNVAFPDSTELTVEKFLELGSIVFDCNNNEIDDGLDISSGTSVDADQDGVPDECEDHPTSALFEYVIATRVGGAIMIEWRVMSDSNVSCFYVYRAISGSEREQIGQVLFETGRDYEFVDERAPGGEVAYWLAGLSRTGELEWYGPIKPGGGEEHAAGVLLHQNIPNPFGTSTRITFEVPQRERAILRVLDLQGREIRTLAEGELGPGKLQVSWDGADNEGRQVGAGVYVCRLEVGGTVLARKLIFTR